MTTVTANSSDWELVLNPLPPTHLQVIIDWLFSAFRDCFRRCSVWLGLSLAIIRTISLKMATNKNFDFINSSRTGQFSILIVLLISTTFSICYIFRYQIVQTSVPWVPGTGCPDSLKSIEEFRFPYKLIEMTASESFLVGSARKAHLLLTAIFGKIIPSILFPISAVILMLELRKTNKLPGSSTRQTDKTNRLVVYMTITFIIIELPIGICNLITSTRRGYDDAVIPESIAKMMNIINVTMTCTHCFLCTLMSSQYQKTVKLVFGFHSNVIRSRAMFSHYSNSK
ncbi:hypothetical protein CAEBREN_19498 [Caenorhabditis brenneri]|uniref:G-protein coupled receptors family 1 profile domain-containing protein n=1 Tax=Caenorhabditis brenneri TaxID=135651 RepID=G0N1F2_CAEBE|nr:hypothetical protein CAEBREN_19498 [Caenorhabditis brenneri]